MTPTAESAVTRLTKETAKERIEVAAVPVRNNVGKTFYDRNKGKIILQDLKQSMSDLKFRI